MVLDMGYDRNGLDRDMRYDSIQSYPYSIHSIHIQLDLASTKEGIGKNEGISGNGRTRRRR